MMPWPSAPGATPAEHKAGDERGARRHRGRILPDVLLHLLHRCAGRLGRRVLGLPGDLLLLGRGRLLERVGFLTRLPLSLAGFCLGLPLDVALLREGGGSVAELLASLLDVLADLLRRTLLLGHWRPSLARRFVCSTSAFVLSTACSGTGGVPSSTFRFPVSARTPAAAPRPTATIRAASQASRMIASARIAATIRAPSAYRPTSPAAPKAPAPSPRRLPFSATSALASSTSFCARDEAWSVSLFVSSASDCSSSGSLALLPAGVLLCIGPTPSWFANDLAGRPATSKPR